MEMTPITMRMSLTAVIWVVTVYYACTWINGVEGYLDTTYQYHRCRGPLIPPTSDYWSAIDEVVRKLRDVTPRRRIYNYMISHTVNRQGCKGYARCNPDLPAQDCDVCLQTADSIMLRDCGFSREAEVALTDCYISYVNSTIVRQQSS